MRPRILVFDLEAAWAIEAFVPCFHSVVCHLTFITIENREVGQNEIDVHGSFRLYRRSHWDLNWGRLGVVAAVVIDEIVWA